MLTKLPNGMWIDLAHASCVESTDTEVRLYPTLAPEVFWRQSVGSPAEAQAVADELAERVNAAQSGQSAAELTGLLQRVIGWIESGAHIESSPTLLIDIHLAIAKAAGSR